MKTFRRDRLLKLALAGRLTMVGAYHFDDVLGASRADREIPVRVLGNGDVAVDGVCCLRRDHFTSYGRAYENDDGTIHLHVHSNLSYDFRVNDPAKTA